MKKSTLSLTLLAALFTAPAFADGNQLHYEHNRQSYISYDRAAQIAVSKVGGGQATEVEFDRSRTKPDHFDVDVRLPDGRKYEVEIDAQTGNVLSSHLDN
ncbi:peptidase [Eikenella sp. NML96-A-049]|uniref:PepSY domain-containing protein n=1 Tax=unclassified Eikenella TaxID=2639367 RepID=UPI0007E1D909|nr:MULTISPECIES: PepSY domain-containing protein [unclassified Eikenella]OAM34407.1 peptidase [Eikenella sp. NML070372]OAM39152.1 peptidase [Eikenella sp. NML96-A-049]